MSGERVERRLAAILAADVAGYSRLMGRDEAGTLGRLRAHRRELIDPKIAEHKGRVVKTTGDGLLLEFPSVVEAVACAVAVQRKMAERNSGTPEEQRIVFRIGINLGDVIVEGDDIHGDGVNVAARLEAMAEPGGICVSGTVRDHIGDRLDLTFDDLGDQNLKNITRSVSVFRVRIARAEIAPTGSAARGTITLTPPEKPSIAVLPFQNMTGDPEQEYFVDGMVEEITTAIARLPWLFVIARNSSFTYKGKAVDVKQVARELGVRYVLEGSVRKAGSRVRITGQLIDTSTGAHIWADRFDGALDDVFELQDRVASSVAGAIEPKLRQSEIERVSRKPPENFDAYDFYLRALAENKFTIEGIGEAVRLLQNAIEIDRFHAPAIAMLAWCRARQKALGHIQSAGPEVTEGLVLARRGIELGQNDPDALWMAGLAIWSLGGETSFAEIAIDRAIALNPNLANAWNARAMVKAVHGHFDFAIEAVEQATRLSPLDPNGYYFNWSIVHANFAAGRFNEAMAWVDRLLKERPNLVNMIRLKIALCGQLGLVGDAQPWIARLRELQPSMVSAAPPMMPGMISPDYWIKILEGLRKAGLPEE